MPRDLRFPAAVLFALLAVPGAGVLAQQKKAEPSQEEINQMFALDAEAARLGITPQELKDLRAEEQPEQQAELPVQQQSGVNEAAERPPRTGPAVQVVTPDAAGEARRSSRRGPASQPQEDLGTVPLWYQLPLRVRQDLPELDMTLHYFNEESALSFVKLNGERYAEGDQVERKLHVRQIRRDGVVLQFHDDVFLLNRR